jgi:hypothetical protein
MEINKSLLTRIFTTTGEIPTVLMTYIVVQILMMGIVTAK